jgi:FAD/FMN-containing dehydrogenase
LEEQKQVVESIDIKVTKNNAGYNLLDIRRKDGSFDLTPLFVGSQGTLGIISEITLETEVYNPETVLMVADFEDLDMLQAAVLELRRLPEMPSAIEMVDGNLLKLVAEVNPNLLKNVVKTPFPAAILLVEFDNHSERTQKKVFKKAQKIFEKYARRQVTELDRLKQEELWKIRHASATIVAQADGNRKAIPIIEDGIVPVDRLKEYLDGVYALFAQAGLKVAAWGHAGDANLHLQPFLDLSQVGDRQKTFKLMDDYYKLVLSLGGSTAAEHNDGRLRGPYLPAVYGPDVYSVFQKVKQIFDPYGTLNPGVKINVGLEDIKPLMRSSYSLEHLYNHMPRT